MVEIHECRVSPLGDGIFLWTNVIDGPDYANVFLEKIAIVQYDRFTVDYPDKQNILVELTGENLGENRKEVKMTISSAAFDFEKYFYFIYIKTIGQPTSSNGTETYCDSDLVISAAVNLLPLYHTKIKLLKEYVKTCGKNEQLIIDIILKEEIFKNSLTLGEFSTSVQIWDDLLNYDLAQANHKTSYEGYKNVQNNKQITL